MPLADVNGQHVSFGDSGGDVTAVLFRHGFSMDHKMFADQDDISDRFGEISTSAIVFHREADTFIPMAKAEQLPRELGSCKELVRIPGVGHASNLSPPDGVNSPLPRFLQAHAR